MLRRFLPLALALLMAMPALGAPGKPARNESRRPAAAVATWQVTSARTFYLAPAVVPQVDWSDLGITDVIVPGPLRQLVYTGTPEAVRAEAEKLKASVGGTARPFAWLDTFENSLGYGTDETRQRCQPHTLSESDFTRLLDNLRSLTAAGVQTAWDAEAYCFNLDQAGNRGAAPFRVDPAAWRDTPELEARAAAIRQACGGEVALYAMPRAPQRHPGLVRFARAQLSGGGWYLPGSWMSTEKELRAVATWTRSTLGASCAPLTWPAANNPGGTGLPDVATFQRRVTLHRAAAGWVAIYDTESAVVARKGGPVWLTSALRPAGTTTTTPVTKRPGKRGAGGKGPKGR